MTVLVRRLAGGRRCKWPCVEMPGKALLKKLHSMSLESCGLCARAGNFVQGLGIGIECVGAGGEDFK